METAKTLWLLDIPYGIGRWGLLIPLYAVDEQEAWIEAQCWALQNDRPLPEDATLVHFPQGFTVNRFVLPGYLEEKK